MIDEGLAIMERADGRGAPGRVPDPGGHRRQHARAPRPEDTDWPQIAALYAALEALRPTPVVRLNRGVAIAMADGPAAGLRLVDGLAAELGGYHLFHSARADLLRRLGRDAEAAVAYRRALDLASNPTERAFLEGRLASLR